MVTTVQISTETKESLLVVKAKLEQYTGQKRTLEDAIKWLLERESNPTFHERNRASEISFGSIKDLDITLEDLSELRKKRNSRFANF